MMMLTHCKATLQYQLMLTKKRIAKQFGYPFFGYGSVCLQKRKGDVAIPFLRLKKSSTSVY